MPATIGLGAFTFTMSVMPGTPSVNNAIPMPYFGTTTFAAPGLGIIASVIIMVFGMWWLAPCRSGRAQGRRGLWRRCGSRLPSIDEKIREHATAAGDFDPAEIHHGKHSASSDPPFVLAVLPLVVVIVTELPDVAGRASTARFFVSGQGSLGRDHDRGRGRRLVGCSWRSRLRP